MLNKKSENDKLFFQEGEKQCIWMSAGVISFKLCPINFDCEHCEFDAVMRPRKKSFSQTPRDTRLE